MGRMGNSAPDVATGRVCQTCLVPFPELEQRCTGRRGGAAAAPPSPSLNLISTNKEYNMELETIQKLRKYTEVVAGMGRCGAGNHRAELLEVNIAAMFGILDQEERLAELSEMGDAELMLKAIAMGLGECTLVTEKTIHHIPHHFGCSRDRQSES